MEEPLLTSGFNKGFSEVGDLHLEDLTTIHSPWGLVIQLDLLATSSNLHQIRGKDSLTNASVLEFALNICQSLFSRLLFSESSEQVQVAAVGSISRLLCHAIKSGLLGTKPLWIKCLEILPLYEKKVVRRSFCLQIHCFIEKNVMDSLFEDDDTCNKTKE